MKLSDATDNDIGPNREGPGVSLRRAREARGMGIQDIAQDLHLDPWIIEALETDNFEALGAPVFAKGHLRQYGALLGLATDDLMIAYYRVRGRHDAPPPPITSTMTRPETNRKAVLAGVALAVLVLGTLAVLLWWLSRGTGDTVTRAPASAGSVTQPQSLEPAPPPADTAPVPATAPPENDIAAVAGPAGEGAATDETSEAAPGDVAEPVASPPAITSEAAPVAVQPAPAGEQLGLQLTFSGESWVEVYDRAGARLIYGMYGPGGVRTVRGAAPIEIYLGRSRDVSVAVNGRPYPVPAQSVRGNTARFVIEAGAR